MENQTVTYHVQLKTQIKEGPGYINYVFENLEFQDYDYRYITAVRFPNWDQGSIENGEIGYVVVKYVREGVDKWYDGENFIVYNEDNIIFYKFIREKEKVVPTEIILD